MMTLETPLFGHGAPGHETTRSAFVLLLKQAEHEYFHTSYQSNSSGYTKIFPHRAGCALSERVGRLRGSVTGNLTHRTPSPEGLASARTDNPIENEASQACQAAGAPRDTAPGAMGIPGGSPCAAAHSGSGGFQAMPAGAPVRPPTRSGAGNPVWRRAEFEGFAGIGWSRPGQGARRGV